MARLAEMTKDELYDLARDRDIEGRSNMDKDELIEALGRTETSDGHAEGQSETEAETEPALDRSTTSNRPIWRGAVTFGLITVPVGLYTAVEDRDVSFRLLSGKDGARVRYKRVNEATGKEVDWDEIVKGIEYEPGRFAVFTDEELDQLQPESVQAVDVAQFVQAEEIDPLYFERSYYMAPDRSAVKAYRLLVEALERSNRVGVAKVTIRQKERLCLLRPKDGVLVLETMHWPDEIRIPAFDQLDTDVDINPQELEMAQNLIGYMEAEFDPTRYHDRFRERVEEAVQAKIEGEEISLVAPAQPEPTKVTDLLEVLRASVDEARQKKSA